MTKVYPNAASEVPKADSDRHVEETLTVWKKSLLFNCNGFTVFDTKGNLLFRVDNYMAGNKGEILLMDAAGKPLLTIRRKPMKSGLDKSDGSDLVINVVFWSVAHEELARQNGRSRSYVLGFPSSDPSLYMQKLSFGDHWLVFDGEETVNPRFSVKKNVNILNSSSLAHVTLGCGASPKHVIYHIEGSYSQRCCTVYDDKRHRMAEIKRKEAVGGAVFGLDVFRLIVQPEFDSAVAMSLVILLEQMFGSTRRFRK